MIVIHFGFTKKILNSRIISFISSNTSMMNGHVMRMKKKGKSILRECLIHPFALIIDSNCMLISYTLWHFFLKYNISKNGSQVSYTLERYKQ
jgi:hypothetical protein